MHIKQKKTYKKISEITSRSISTIQTVIGRFKYEGRIENNPRSGRRSKLTAGDQRQIKRKVVENPFLSASKIAAELEEHSGIQVHQETVWRAIKNNGFKSCTPRKKPHVSMINRKKRLEFGKKYLNYPKEFWRKVIFSDESKYNLFGSDGRKRFWRQKGKALDPKNT